MIQEVHGNQEILLQAENEVTDIILLLVPSQEKHSMFHKVNIGFILKRIFSSWF